MQTATTKESQTAKILRLLKANGYLTNRELNRICFRYSARIFELRKEGHQIVPIHEEGSKWRFIYKYPEGEHIPFKAKLRLRSVRESV